MNSRKSATAVAATLSRQIKSGAFLKTPPPAYYPILSYPPAPSLVRFLPPRPASDLPPSAVQRLSPYQIKHQLLERSGLPKKEREAQLKGLRIRTRRPPPRAANSKNNRPLPIVFPEDQLRLKFFRDHPFEAYRPVYLVEGESIQAERGPKGEAWTELSQRTTIPTAEDAIAFTLNLHETFQIPIATAYATSIHQFRSLRAAHESSLRAATLEAKSHGAIFFGEIERSLRLEERALDEWTKGREIQEKIAASRPAVAGAPGADLGFLGAGQGVVGEVEVEVASVEAFTGGVEYVQRFTDLMEGEVPEAEGDLNDVQEKSL